VANRPTDASGGIAACVWRLRGRRLEQGNALVLTVYLNFKSFEVPLIRALVSHHDDMALCVWPGDGNAHGKAIARTRSEGAAGPALLPTRERAEMSFVLNFLDV
jgi:hypothetical protein